MPGIEYIDESTSMTVGPLEIPGVYSVQDTRGQHAPEHRVEDGFDFTTRVGPEPIEAEVDAYVGSDRISDVTSLAEMADPIPMSVGTAVLGECVITSGGITINEEGTTAGSYDITIAVREIQVGSSGTANVKVVSEESGTKSEKAGKEGSGGPAIAQTDSQSTSNGPEGGEGSDDNPFSGIISGTRSWLGYDE